MNIIDDLKDCLTFDLSYAKPYIRTTFDYEQVTAPKEHYRLLAHLSYKFNNQTLYDIGSYRGLSAIALAANQENKVISYDIDDFLRVEKMNNVEYKIGNCYEDPGLLSSPLIMLDVDPHEGTFEQSFVEYLLKQEYKGVVVLDDIHLNPAMIQFWNWISGVEKHDITEYGHHSGTGLVIFQ